MKSVYKRRMLRFEEVVKMKGGKREAFVVSAVNDSSSDPIMT